MCFLNNDTMQSKKTTFRNDRGMKNAIFHDFFCLIFYQNLPTSLPWQPAKNMMIYVSVFCFHIKTHHIGKFEENLRPCVNSLHYRMLHDYRELILKSSRALCLPFSIVITSLGEEGAALCASRAFVCFVRVGLLLFFVLSFFSTSWFLGY